MPQIETKVCASCGTEKPIAEFQRKCGATTVVRSKCRNCRYAEKRGWYQNNKDKVAEYNLSRKEIHREYVRTRRAQNPDRARELERARYHADPGKAAEKRRRMYAAHRDNRLADALKRRQDMPWEKPFWQATLKARELNAIPVWADFDAIKAIYREKHERQQREGVALHVDHIIPLKHAMVVGLHCEQNLQILTASENARKNNSLPGHAHA